MKKILMVSTSILLFTACGNSSKSSSSTNNLSKSDFKSKDYMIMGHNTAISECNTDFVKQIISGPFFANRFEYPSDIDKNSIIVLLGTRTIPCTDYGRVDDLEGTCVETDLDEQTGQTCVIGFNLIK